MTKVDAARFASVAVGLALVGVGVGFFSPFVALIVVGGALVALGLWS